MSYQNDLPNGPEPEEGEKRGRGRPPFVPTDDQRNLVRHCIASGLTRDATRLLIIDPNDGEPISAATLDRYFKREMETGLPQATAKIASKLFQKAMNGDMTAIIFWLKTRARWKEAPQQVAFTDPEGNAVEPPSLADLYSGIALAKAKPQPDTGQSEEQPDE